MVYWSFHSARDIPRCPPFPHSIAICFLQLFAECRGYRKRHREYRSLNSPSVSASICPPRQEPEQVTVPLKGHDFAGLGFTVQGGMRDGIFVNTVSQHGPALESGLVQSGEFGCLTSVYIEDSSWVRVQDKDIFSRCVNGTERRRSEVCKEQAGKKSSLSPTRMLE